MLLQLGDEVGLVEIGLGGDGVRAYIDHKFDVVLFEQGDEVGQGAAVVPNGVEAKIYLGHR